MTKNDTSDYSKLVSAVFERDDPFYDSVASIWNLDLYYLDKDGQKSTIPISGHAFPDIVDEFDKKLSKSKSFIKTEDERYMQYGRYVYVRKTLFKKKEMKDHIELTEEMLASLKPNNIIAVTVAESGAMGDPGAIEIVDKKLNIYHTYSDKIDSKILHEKIPFLKDLELFFGNINKLDEKKWSGLYAGFGNYLFVRPKYTQPMLEYVFNNYDYDKISKSELYVHWYEALKETMGKNNG